MCDTFIIPNWPKNDWWSRGHPTIDYPARRRQSDKLGRFPFMK
jgi:hypothetical protein